MIAKEYSGVIHELHWAKQEIYLRDAGGVPGALKNRPCCINIVYTQSQSVVWPGVY